MEALWFLAMIGMQDVLQVISEQSHNIVMEESLTGLDEVVVIGYGTMKKRELTGAISSIKGDEVNKMATSDFGSAIQGKLAGVSVRQGNAAPGENAEQLIRGITSFQDGGSGPLYVVDGVTYIDNPNITPRNRIYRGVKRWRFCGNLRIKSFWRCDFNNDQKRKRRQYECIIRFILRCTTDYFKEWPLANTTDALYINDIQYRYDETNTFDPLEFNKDGLLFDTNWLEDLQVDLAPMQNHSLSVNGGKDGLTYNVIATFI